MYRMFKFPRRNVSRLVQKLFANNSIVYRTCSSSGNSSLSYIHRCGDEPLKYLNVGQLVSKTANKFPDRQIVVSCDENIQLTYAEALRKADKLAAGLLNMGLEKNDKVAIWAPNYEFWIVCWMAIARAGLVCVALNPVYQLPELDYCIKKVQIKSIIAPESFRKQKHYEMLATLLANDRNTPLKSIIIYGDKKLPDTLAYDDVLNYSPESDVAQIEKLQATISPDECFNIQFTSGTTGRPKAARMSHFSLVNNGYDMGKRLQLDKNPTRICVNVPLFHAYGTAITIMVALNYAATMVLPAPHFTPELSLRAIASEKCNCIYGTPTMYVDLIAKRKEMNLELPEIEIANTAGAICTPQLVQDIQKHLNVKKMSSMYGLTEVTSAVFQSLPHDSNESLQHTVGYICDHTEAKVVDSNGCIVPFGQPGELCIRSYLTFLDYYDDEERTREVLGADKWLRTGDQFVLHENGYGQIVGRFKEMIIRGGENIFPKEIEDFLNTHPHVKETHVIGINDERMGEEVAAFVRLNDADKGLSHDDVKKFCSGSLAHFKVPRYVIIVDEFPRTVSGKVQKFKFAKAFEAEIKKAVEAGREIVRKAI